MKRPDAAGGKNLIPYFTLLLFQAVNGFKYIILV